MSKKKGDKTMKDTIKSKNGFSVVHKPKTPENIRYIKDGSTYLFRAVLRTMEDYIDEYINGNNECAVKCEVFTTIKGNQFIYWTDTETGEDFITKVIK